MSHPHQNVDLCSVLFMSGSELIGQPSYIEQIFHFTDWSIFAEEKIFEQIICFSWRSTIDSCIYQQICFSWWIVKQHYNNTPLIKRHIQKVDEIVFLYCLYNQMKCHKKGPISSIGILHYFKAAIIWWESQKNYLNISYSSGKKK